MIPAGQRRVYRNGRIRTVPEGRREGGYVMFMLAITMIVLFTACAFAVDLGSFYARASRIQRAADAAALAGVVWMPGNFAQAQSYAIDSAKQNGFPSSGVTVAAVAGNPYQLKVTINDPKVPRFFSTILTKSPMSITRSATAEFAPVVPLGSPDNRLGNDPLSSPAYNANLWASISAPYTDLINGDPYSTKCGIGGSGTGCAQTNTQYRTTGYKYAIDVPASAVGRTLTVSVYDAGNYARSNYANVETADNGTVNTSFELFDINPAPLDISSDFSSALSLNGDCTSSPGKFYIADNTSASTYQNKWATLCTIAVTKAGTYHLQVKSSSLTTVAGAAVADAGNGWNQFSLKASVSGTGVTPALYGVGDLSLFNNLPGLTGNITATFYFAQIAQVYAGKTLTVNLYDPGDGASGNYYVNVLKPGGATTSCSYGVSGTTLAAASPCRIQTRDSSGNTYNGKWLEIDIDIPTTYTCSADCWWKISYEFLGVTSGNSPNDRTVWSAALSGNPIHLVQ